jgi:capsule polysaccharide export protein KpsE/RkpR
MTPLEALLILILVVVVIILIYSYIQNDRQLNLRRVREDATTLGEKVYGGASSIGEKVSGDSSMSGMSEKINVSGVSDTISGVGEKIKVTVGDSVSTDYLSDRINQFLNEQSDQLIKDWELATKKDLSDLEERYSKVSTDLIDLDNKFGEFREQTNQKMDTIEERLEKLEKSE